MNDERLARRYRNLLAFYPRWYRERRGAVAPDNVILFLQVLPVALVYLGAVGYVAVDPRPALAVAAFFVLVVAQSVALVVAVGGLSLVVEVSAVLAVLLVAAVVAVAAAALGLRRQVAVLPTRVEG